MNRIDFIASLTKGANTILDIGCDHAYTVISAVKNYGVNFAIASDIALGPLNQAKDNIYKNGLEDKIKLVLSNGFKNINDDFDLAIISGMGGMLITNIIEGGIEKLYNKRLILSPHSDFYKLRLYLANNNFIITDEYAFYDKNKYYEVIIATSGKESYNDFELKYGPILLKKKEEAFIKYLKIEKDKYEKALVNITNKDTKNEILEKIKEVEVILND